MSTDDPALNPKRLLSWRILFGVLLLSVAGLAILLIVVGDRSDPRAAARKAERMAPALDTLPSSSLVIPVAFDLGSALEQLEPELPREFGSLEERRSHPSHENLRYAFEAERAPFRFELRGDTVHATTTVRYRGRLSYETPFGRLPSVACGVREAGSNAPGVRVHLSSPLEIDREWRLRSQVEVERVEPLAGTDRCVLSMFGLRIDATGAIVEAIRSELQRQTGAIDVALAGVPIRFHLDRFWTTLQQALPLGEGLWMTLAPRAVRYGSVGGERSEGQMLRTSVGVDALPCVTFGAKPEFQSGPLPPLGRFPGETENRETTQTVIVEGRAEYEPLSERATEALQHQEFDVLGRPVRIEEVTLSGMPNGRVVAEIRVRGAAEGTVLMVGTPMFDAERNEFTVPDLDFSMDTNNVLARTATWVLRNGFRERVRRQVRWSIGEVLPWGGKAATDRSVDVPLSDAMRLDGRLGPMRITTVVVTETAVVVRAQTEASIRVVDDSR